MTLSDKVIIMVPNDKINDILLKYPDLETKEKNDTDALYNLDHYDKDIIIETIQKFNSTIELMKNNGDLPYADEVLENNNLDVYEYHNNHINLHISKK